jgi:hypothetical protein
MKMLFLAMSITEYFRAYYTNKSDSRVVEYIHVGLFRREDFRLIIYISVKQQVYREQNTSKLIRITNPKLKF